MTQGVGLGRVDRGGRYTEGCGRGREGVGVAESWRCCGSSLGERVGGRRGKGKRVRGRRGEEDGGLGPHPSPGPRAHSPVLP